MYTLYSDKASNLCLGTQTYSNFKGIFPHKKKIIIIRDQIHIFMYLHKIQIIIYIYIYSIEKFSKFWETIAPTSMWLHH